MATFKKAVSHPRRGRHRKVANLSDDQMTLQDHLLREKMKSRGRACVLSSSTLRCIALALHQASRCDHRLTVRRLHGKRGTALVARAQPSQHSPSRKLTACSVSVRLSAFLWPSLAHTTAHGKYGGDRQTSCGVSSDGVEIGGAGG